MLSSLPLRCALALAAVLVLPGTAIAASGSDTTPIVRQASTGAISVTVGEEDVTTSVPSFAPCKQCAGPPLSDVNVTVRATVARVRGALITVRHYESSSTVIDADTDYDPPLPDGADLGSGAADCSGVPMTLDDQAGSWWVTGGSAPYAGAFRPTLGREGALANLHGAQRAGVPFAFTSTYRPVGDDAPSTPMTLHCLGVTATTPDWVYLPTPWDAGKVTFKRTPAVLATRKFRVSQGLTGRMVVGPWKNWGSPKATAFARITGPARAWKGYYVDVTATGLKRCKNGYRAYTRLSWSWRAKGNLRPTGPFRRDTRRNLTAYC